MRAGDEDDVTDFCAEVICHVFAEDDWGHDGYARADAGEGVGRIFGRWRSRDNPFGSAQGRRGGRPHVIFFWGGSVFFERGGGTFFDGVEEIADFSFVRWNHALEDCAAGAGAAGD